MVPKAVFIRDRVKSTKRSIGWFEIPQIAPIICIKIDRYSHFSKR